MHEHEQARGQKPEQAAERAAPQQVPAALALQRQIGNRAFGRLLVARQDAGTAPAPEAAPAAPIFPIPAGTAQLDVVSYGPTKFTAELRKYQDAFVMYAGNCWDAALETFGNLTDKKLHVAAGKQPGLRTYDRTGKTGRSGAKDWKQTDLNWNETKVAETVAYIKGAIDRGLPVMVGVNEADTEQQISAKTGRPINEGITDHFLIIVGYTAEKLGGAFPMPHAGVWAVTKLQAIDNATNDAGKKFPTFDVGPRAIRKAATGIVSDQAADAEYQLTQVRVYADDLDAVKTTTAWWE